MEKETQKKTFHKIVKGHQFILDRYTRRGPLVSNARTATNNAEPMTDQTMGKDLPPTLIAKTSGRPKSPAIQVPITAPIKPTSMDVMQPPTE
jgi:hypothetical protein